MHLFVILFQMLSLIVNDRPTSTSSSCGTYAHCVTLTLPSSGVASETNFVAPYKFVTSVYLKTVANGGYVNNTVAQTGGSGLTVPADAIFASDACATPLAGWEWASYSGTTGSGAAYPNIGTASNSQVVYFCVGKASVTTWQGNVPATWDSSYGSVNHFGDGTTLDYNDSTSNAYVFTAIGTPTATTGILAGGITTSIGNGAASPTVTAAAASATISAWVKTSDTSATYQRVVLPHQSDYYGLQITDSGYAMFMFGYPTGSPGYIIDSVDIRNGNWRQVVGVFDSVATTLKLYVDGALAVTSSADASNPSPYTAFRVGLDWDNANDNPLNGSISEVWRSSSVRSANRIGMEFAAFSAPTTWMTLAVVQ